MHNKEIKTKHLTVPTVLHAMRVCYKPDFSNYFHQDQNNEVLYIIDGKVRLLFESGEEYVAGPNDTLFIPHGVRHRDIFEEYNGLEVYHMNFKWRHADRLFALVGPDCVSKLPNREKNEIRLLFDMLRLDTESGNFLLTEIRLAHILGIIWKHTFSAEHNDASDNLSRIYNYAKNYMIANLSHNLSIDSVAEHLRVSRSTLTRAFRLSGSLSFNAFLRSVRMHQAYFLLQEQALNLADCAQRCGFNDPSYFAKVFKKHFGFSPKDFH